MHPHHLHALTAAHQLTQARTALQDLRFRRLPVDDARDGLRSTSWGARGGGGFGDPVGRAALLGDTGRDELADLARSTYATLVWLASTLNVPWAGDPLAPLTAAIPRLTPGVAGQLVLWLTEADRKVRDIIGWMPLLTAWPGDCPACGQRLLQLHTAGPGPEWTVTCSARDCVCAGDACPCRMPVRAVGVAHIWLRSVIVAPANAETRKAA